MRPLVIASDMWDEIAQLPGWFDCVEKIADGGILIVDSGSDDGTIEYCRDRGAVVIVDDIIRREGYGPARNHLREMSRKYFPDAVWMAYLDADERILPEDFHRLRFIKDYLINGYDCVCMPRIDWYDLEMNKAAKDWHVYPDWQARMTLLDSDISYVRRLHENITGFKKMYMNLATPKINHFHRSAGKIKRDAVGKLCAKLHMEDDEYGNTYPEHHKEAYYRRLLEKEGL